MLSNAIQRSWYEPNLLTWLLLPISYFYRLVVWLRQKAYSIGILKTHRLSVPVIVVGNITVGGTGKTPLVIWLCQYLKNVGWKPGVVSRGYGGRSSSWPQIVSETNDPYLVGDEPVLIAQRTQCPVSVAPERVVAARRLLGEFECDVIVSDDGLQHLTLNRDIEIAVIDGERRLGNEHCLPAGPLREPIKRLNTVDLKVTNGKAQDIEYEMLLEMSTAINLLDEGVYKSLDEFKNKPIHAVAGIGNPNRFFTQLKKNGLDILPHPFPDHHAYTADDLRFNDAYPVLMTEKDAVKCKAFASKDHWYVPVDAIISERFEAQIKHRLANIQPEINV
ncbi:MAG: tetraacyldisaccharide 4'-kinase [Gammaproteobacteria bacterium]|nr:tetraacyldisaccharide 4'-kinase [Gammaproteobacteria bacterium]